MLQFWTLVHEKSMLIIICGAYNMYMPAYIFAFSYVLLNVLGGCMNYLLLDNVKNGVLRKYKINIELSINTRIMLPLVTASHFVLKNISIAWCLNVFVFILVMYSFNGYFSYPPMVWLIMFWFWYLKKCIISDFQ